MPERALFLARSHETICLSAAVASEIREVLARPKFPVLCSKRHRVNRATLLQRCVAGRPRPSPICSTVPRFLNERMMARA